MPIEVPGQVCFALLVLQVRKLRLRLVWAHMCIYVCACVCVYAGVYVYTFVCKYPFQVCPHAYICSLVCLYMCASMHAVVNGDAYVCVYICWSMCACRYTYTCVYKYPCICIHDGFYIYVYASMHGDMHIIVQLALCICVHVCVCIHVSMHLCVIGIKFRLSRFGW